MNLKISKDLSLPIDLTTQVEVILAKRRAGKSYTMRRMAEQLLEVQQQVVLVDPKGDQWGLRSSADGKKAGYPVLILGGEHGDIPLEAGSGEVVARLVVEERVSVLLDLSQFRKHEVASFMTVFLENLYRLKAQEKYRTPMKLIIDEADAIAPQRPQKGEERMLGAIEDIVRRGGQRGIGCTLVTQRSAVLNKNVLTQAQVLIVLRTIAPQDIAAMKAWIDVHGTQEQGRELIESLPSLPIGDAWFWSPGWPTDAGIFKRVHVLPIETFDSGATPKPGQKQIIPKTYAEVDLDALKGQMAATIEKKKADDPKILHAEIKRLTEELKVPQSTTNLTTTEIVKVPILTAAQIKQLSVIFEKMYKELDRHTVTLAETWGKLQPLAIEMSQAFSSLAQEKTKPGFAPASPTPDRTPLQISRHDPGFAKRTEQKVRENDADTPLSKGASLVLAYLRSVYPHWKSKAQMWVAVGYAPGSNFNNSVYELTGVGLIEKEGTGKYAALEQGDSFDTSLEKWDAKLSLCARKVFQILRDYLERSFSKEELAQITGYTLGSNFNNGIYELTGKELIIKVGTSYQINPEILDL